MQLGRFVSMATALVMDFNNLENIIYEINLFQRNVLPVQAIPSVVVELILASLERLVQMENAWHILSVSLVLLMYFANVD